MVDFAETFPQFAVKRSKIKATDLTPQSAMFGQCLRLFGLNDRSVSLSAQISNILRPTLCHFDIKNVDIMRRIIFE